MSGSSRDISPHSQAGKVLSSLRLRPMSNIELVSELNIAHPPASVRGICGVRGCRFRPESIPILPDQVKRSSAIT